MILYALVAALILAAVGLAVQLVIAAAKTGQLRPRPEALALGAVTNFFDTLGIGSFAPTVVWFRFRRLVPDRLIPLTMLVGYTVPAIIQGVIFLILLGVKVDPLLLLASMIAMVAGGFAGVPIAARAPIRLIQFVIGTALLIAAFFYSLSNLGLMPPGGTATSLPLSLSIVTVVAHFALGILLSFGVGNYAPTLAMLSLMGMDPRLAFPIMAAAAGFAGTAASVRCIGTLKIDLRIVLGLTLGAIPAILLAAFVVKQMPLEFLRWLVVVVVTYAGLTLLAAAARKADMVPDDPAVTAITD
ncbi:MAG: sulfite exporter TauE/SafE family protein [Pseudomonadota bacterium]